MRSSGLLHESLACYMPMHYCSMGHATSQTDRKWWHRMCYKSWCLKSSKMNTIPKKLSCCFSFTVSSIVLVECFISATAELWLNTQIILTDKDSHSCLLSLFVIACFIVKLQYQIVYSPVDRSSTSQILISLCITGPKLCLFSRGLGFMMRIIHRHLHRISVTVCCHDQVILSMT